jgi:ATP-binding cassette, subfamily B, bacterial
MGRAGGPQRPGGRGEPPPQLRMRERFGALRNVPPFLRMVWQTSPALTLASLSLRLVRALLPVATLFVGKLIIDEVLRLAQLPDAPGTLTGWLDSGLLSGLGWLLAIELLLAVGSDVLGRLVSLIDALLGEQLTNATSIRLMEHAATLDLEDFEDSELQDRLDRARRQTMGRSTLMSQLFGQAQDVVTIATFAVGLVLYAPWLIALLLLALVPAFLGEAHFNAASYSLNYSRTPERREIDYVRQTGASVETAKEVKIFGLNSFLIERYRRLATTSTMPTAGWPSARGLGRRADAIGTLGYYVAYAYIAFRTVTGALTIGDLTFLAGSFRRLRNLLEGLLIGFSQTAGQALYLDDLFSFFEIEPEITSPPEPRPFPGPSVRDLSSTTSASATPARNAGPCATSASRCTPARYWRWWARTAPARRRSSSCSRDSTTRTRAGSCSTATTSGNTTWTSSAPTWASSSRTSSATT